MKPDKRFVYKLKQYKNSWLVTIPIISVKGDAADIENMIPQIKERLQKLYDKPILTFDCVEYLGLG